MTAARSPCHHPSVIDIRPDDILHLLERDGRPGEDVLAFDADGTLWSGDVGVDMFDQLLATRGVRPDALARMQSEARAHDVSVVQDATDQAHLLFDAFCCSQLPETMGIELMAWAYAGYRTEELEQFARISLTRGNLRSRYRREVVEILRFAQKKGIEVRIVSASPRVVVELAASDLGVVPAQVIAATPVVRDGIVQPAMEGILPYADGKRAALQEQCSSRRVLAAFGDSGFDFDMLAQAVHPVAVFPKSSLQKQAERLPRLMQLVMAD